MVAFKYKLHRIENTVFIVYQLNIYQEIFCVY